LGARKTGGKRERELRRKKPSRPPKPIILIVCEGVETEPNYFHKFRQNLRFSKEQMKICGGDECGTHPKNIVEFAKNKREEIERKKGYDYDEVWCVFDCDAHERIHEAFNQAEALKYRVIFSNPCFELWYLLHYQDQRAHIEREDVFRSLRSHIPDYEKGIENIYTLLSDNQAEAIERAKRIRKWHKDNGDEETENPSTTVDTLVEELESIFSNFQKGR